MAKKLTLVHILISGRVQGVFYRLHTTQKAKQLGLSGWVRNRRDGRVEAVVVGPKEKVNQMIDWFWQGSPLSQVDKVVIVNQKEIAHNPFGACFSRRPTV